MLPCFAHCCFHVVSAGTVASLLCVPVPQFSHWSSYDSSRALFVAVMHLSCASVHERGAEIRVQWWPCDGWHSEPGALLPTRQYRIRMQQQQQQLPIREDKGADDSAAAASAAEERNHADSSSTTPSSSSRPPRVPTPSNGAAGVIHYMFAQPNAADVHNRVLACWHPAWPVVNDVPGRSRVQLCSYAYSADLLFAQLGRDVRSQELLWVEVRPPPSAGASVRLLCAHIIQPDFVVANTTERGNIITQEQAMQQMEWAWTQSAIKNMVSSTIKNNRPANDSKTTSTRMKARENHADQIALRSFRGLWLFPLILLHSALISSSSAQSTLPVCDHS